jgi:hypothetical protein
MAYLSFAETLMVTVMSSRVILCFCLTTCSGVALHPRVRLLELTAMAPVGPTQAI